MSSKSVKILSNFMCYMPYFCRPSHMSCKLAVKHKFLKLVCMKILLICGKFKEILAHLKLSYAYTTNVLVAKLLHSVSIACGENKMVSLSIKSIQKVHSPKKSKGKM